MTLKLYLDNNLNALLEKLNNNSNEKFPNSTTIVVQTYGIQRWVSINLAKKKKVNIFTKFYRPNDIINRIFEIADIEKSHFFSLKKLAWEIFEILAEYDNTNIIKDITETESKRFLFAFKLADLFDQYQIFRPEIIEKWNKDETYFKNDKNEEWQKEIWLKLKEKLGSNNKDKVESKKELLSNINNIGEKIKNEFGSAIHFFGFSYITDYHLDVILKCLKPYINIYFYLFNPSPEHYWYDLISEKEAYWKDDKFKLNYKEGNELLISLGNAAKDMMRMFFGKDEIFLNNLNNESNVKTDNSLLGFVKKSISNNAVYEQKQNISIDDSLQIHGHYSKMREVEGVFNFVAHCFDNDKTLQPEQILIMAPDIDEYVPYIKAIFDNYKLSNGIKIPYTIADVVYSKNNTFLDAFKQILQANEFNFNFNFLYGLTEYDAIATNLKFEDINRLKLLIKKISPLFIKGSIDNDTYYFSWDYTTKRIIYSYTMYNDDVVSIKEKNYLLLNEVEGSMGEDILKFIYLGDTIYNFVNETQKNKTPKEWSNFIIQSVINKLLNTKDYEKDFNYILSVLSEIETYYDKPIEYSTFYEAINKYFSIDTRAKNFITGKITFSSMLPMRSIPFKVIAVMGLNNESFPRIDKPLSYDLIKKEYHLGDRKQKDLDNYLFLETILSAEKKLYLSYIYKDIHNDTELTPSSTLKVLSNFIFKNTNISQNHPHTYHPLHYFNEKNIYASIYENSHIEKTKKLSENKNKDVQKNIINVNINEILKFATDPHEWYKKYKLKINENIDYNYFEENEPIYIQNLEKYWFKEKLLFANLQDEKKENTLFKLKMDKMLPLSIVGNQMFEKYQSFFDKIKNFKLTKIDDLVLEKDVDNVKLIISLQANIIENIKNNCSYVLIRDLRKHASKKVRALLEAAIIAEASNYKNFLFVIYNEKKDKEEITVEEYKIKENKKTDIKEFLENFLQSFLDFYLVPNLRPKKKNEKEDEFSTYFIEKNIEFKKEDLDFFQKNNCN